MSIVFPSQRYVDESKNTTNTSVTLVSDSDKEVKENKQRELLRLLVKIGNDGVNADSMELIRECIGNNNDTLGGENVSTMDFAGDYSTSAEKSIKKINNQLIKDRLNASFTYKNLLNNLARNEVKDPEDDKGSYAYFWKGISNTISSIRENYVDFYAGLMQAYVDIYQKYNDTCVKAASKAVSEGADASHINWSTNTLDKAAKIFEDFCTNEQSTLGSVPHWDNLNAVQRKSMEETLKPAFKVNADTGKVTFNLDFYYNGLTNHPGDSQQDTYSLPEYQAWLAAFNNRGNTFQSNMQTFAQTYSQVNNTFNNLNKILSSTITAMGESANFVLKSIS
ncbi:TPA: IpaD/SipD/SspD family type III secretion system needle tip protein [Escherichia coli]|nr:IpaD/SipD/SspD family type III secretion system needle tip protein [Escherichia coli]HBA9523131.1 IpaD/SipD/SspD family type III secretion system needle tip protein [Escherichia coli]HBA9551069.1 IpaD/SipD/SspD family type III secretion system needle tip protein [Escherichia coli]HBA9560539.1 IpaD/SipD/SspD family type III secretion system needle tip protein [Escherichia coli]